MRKPCYVQPSDQRVKTRRRLQPLKVFCSSTHALHHVPERGYVERPARVDVILKALEALPDVERLPVRSFGERSILVRPIRWLVWLWPILITRPERRPARWRRFCKKYCSFVLAAAMRCFNLA